MPHTSTMSGTIHGTTPSAISGAKPKKSNARQPFDPRRQRPSPQSMSVAQKTLDPRTYAKWIGASTTDRAAAMAAIVDEAEREGAADLVSYAAMKMEENGWHGMRDPSAMDGDDGTGAVAKSDADGRAGEYEDEDEDPEDDE